MLTTGVDEIDNIFKQSATVNSSHRVIAEWNQNAYHGVSYIGSYPIKLTGTASDPDYSETFNSNQELGGWDNGGYFYEYDSDSGTGVIQNKERDILSPIRDIVQTERPDPGIIHPMQYKNSNNTSISTVIISEDASDLKAYQLLQSPKRFYPISKDTKTKYWSSPRQSKPNPSLSLPSAYIGVSDEDGEMSGNNVFVVYDNDILTNKIVIKTQTTNGYPENFKVQVLKSSSPSTWATIFTEDESSRSARSFTKTGYGNSGSNVLTLNNSIDVYVGMFISGTGIPLNTKVEYILPSGMIQLSNNLTSTILEGSPATYTFLDKPLEDGILRLTAELVDNQIVWSIAGGVEKENTISDLLITDISNAEQIKGIRFISTKLSRENGALDVIEVSPRLVIDLSSYTTEIQVNSSIGDFDYGIPSGSLVSSNGSIALFNQNNLISNRNIDSILNGIVKPNVKFTILNKIISDNITKYVPVKVLYADTWEQSTDFTVRVSLTDFTKFWKDTPAPDMLLGAGDGLKASSIIKILLDNAGFTRLNFVKTADSQEYDYEDRKMDFFYCDKKVSIMQVLQEVAKSMQLSMFFDQFGYFTVMTKEAVAQKKDYWDYWLVGDAKNVTLSDPEYSFINTEYKSNIESFDDSIIQPITSGEIQYSNLGIPKMSTYLLEKALSKNYTSNLAAIEKDDVAKILDSGFGELTLNRDLSFVPQQMWAPDDTPGSGEGFLAAGILTEDVSGESYRPKTVIGSQSFQAKNKNDAVRLAYQYIESLGVSQTRGASIFVTEQNLTVAFANKYSGYVFIDSELIKYNGIAFIVSKPGISSSKKIYFSLDELKNDKAQSPSGSSFIPYALIIDLDMKVKTSPTTQENYYTFECAGDGRGQDGSSITSHYSGMASNSNGWTNFKTKLYTAVSSQPTGSSDATLNFLADTGIPTLAGIGTTGGTVTVPTGYAKLVGPPSAVDVDYSQSTYDTSQINISRDGQLQVSGVIKDCGFHPTRIGTRMSILDRTRNNSKNKEKLSKIGGIGFYVSANPSGGYTGYFLEASAISEMDVTSENNYSLKLYKVSSNGTSIVPTRVGAKHVGIIGQSGIAEIAGVNDAGRNTDSYTSTYNVEVVVSGDNNNRTFRILFEGQEFGPFTDSSPLAPTNNVAMFVRDDSNAVYDFVYATTVPDQAEVSVTSPDFLPSPKLNLRNENDRRFLSTYIRQRMLSGYNVFYEDFGNMVREAKKYDVRFNMPAFDTVLIELSKVNPNYFIKDFKATAFGATFWIMNTSSNIIRIDQGSDFPIFISGIGLSKFSESKIDIASILENRQDEDKVNSTLEINKRLYGDTSINISGEYITNRYHAEHLAEWIANNASKEKVEISATIFPNPLLQLGDSVKVFYKDNGYCQNSQGEDKSYVISNIGYSVNESGTTMTVNLQEMI